MPKHTRDLFGTFIGAACIVLVATVVANVLFSSNIRLWGIMLILVSTAINTFLFRGVWSRLRKLEEHIPSAQMDPVPKMESANLVIRYCRHEITFDEYMRSATDLYDKHGPDGDIANFIGAIEHESSGPDQTAEEFRQELIKDAESIIARLQTKNAQ